MKTVKKTMATVLAMTMAMATIASTFTIGVSAETEQDTLSGVATTAAATNTEVSLDSIARKNTTIDVTIPNYRMLASPVYAWTGTMTSTVDKPTVKITNIGDSTLLGGKVTVKGVDGVTLEYEFSTDPDDANYNTSFFSGNDTIIVNFAALNGKLSTIGNVYNNTRPGEATDTMYGEDVFNTPAIASITVQPYFAVLGSKSWSKDKVTAYSDTIKASTAAINGVHAYTVKNVTEDGTTYSDITVAGKGSTDVSAAQAFADDCANFKTELAPYVTKTKEAFPLEDGKTAEEVWDKYAALTGQGADAVESKYVAETPDVFTGVDAATVVEKFVPADGLTAANAPTTSNIAAVPAGIDITTSGYNLAELAAASGVLTGNDIVNVQFCASVTKDGTQWDDDKVEFALLVSTTDGVGVYKTTSASIETLGSTITFSGTAANTIISSDFTSKSNKDTTGKTITLKVNNATALKAALHTGGAGAPATAVWTGTSGKWSMGKQLGIYYGVTGAVNSVDVAGKVPAGMGFDISADTIKALNKAYGMKADTNAVLQFQPVMSADAKKVTFNLIYTQVGTGIIANKTLLFKSDEYAVAGLINAEVVLSGTTAVTGVSTDSAQGAAIRVKITDADALRKALNVTKSGVTASPWATAVTPASSAVLGRYTAGSDAVVPNEKDVIAKLANAGYAKPVKASYSYKTAETKARTLAIPYYTKGDTAFSSKADFITTYNAVSDCLNNLTVANDADAQEPATDMTKYGPLSNFGPTANLYKNGKSKCTSKAEYKNLDAINPTSFGNASTDMIKENRVFGEYDEAAGEWKPVWVDLTTWDDYYNAGYNGFDSTSLYAPGVLAEINDIVGTNKGAVISMHVDPKGFEEDSRGDDAKRWFALNGRCVLRVNGSSSSQYANLVTYDSSTSTFSFNWDEISKNRYNDTTIQVRTLEMLASEKIEVDTITVSIPDQDAWAAATNPKPVDPEDEGKDKDDVVSDGKSDGDKVIEIDDGDKTENDNVDVEEPDDDNNTPPDDFTGDDTKATVTEPADIPDDLKPSTDADVTTKVLTPVETEATVASETKTPTTGETGALAVIPVALAAIAAFAKKKLS